MEQLTQTIYVEGNLLLTCVQLLVLFFAFDCLLGFGYAIKSIKGAVS